MRIITVVFTVRPEKLAEFQALAKVHAEQSVSEPGCRQFDVSSDPGNPARIMFYEVYDDETSFLTHKETSHFKANAPRFAEYASSRERADWTLMSSAKPKR